MELDRYISPEIEQRLEHVSQLLPHELRHPGVLALIYLSLAEDLAADLELAQFGSEPAEGDITSRATLTQEARLTGRITAKAEGVVAGLPVAAAVFRLVDPDIDFQSLIPDGTCVERGQLLAEVSGNGRAVLAGERPALNFLGRLSGIASLTRRFGEAVAGTKAVILDTRKTAPGSRWLDKYAVRMGGGQNHRAGLFDMVLIKDNHIDGVGSLESAVQRVRAQHGPRYLVEIEVKNLEELSAALKLPVDRIMLDNMDCETMRQAVIMTAGKVPLEASGNVSLATVRKIAETGVDFISAGALTHSASVLDISMRLRYT